MAKDSDNTKPIQLKIPTVDTSMAEQKKVAAIIDIKNLYEKHLKNLQADANRILNALEEKIKKEQETLSNLKDVNAPKSGKIDDLIKKDSHYHEKIEKQKKDIESLKRELNSEKVQNIPSSPVGGPPPPPPPPPVASQNKKPLNITKKAEKSVSAKAEKPVGTPAQSTSFDINQISQGRSALRKIDRTSPNSEKSASSPPPNQKNVSREQLINNAKKEGEAQLNTAYQKFLNALEEKQKKLSQVRAEIEQYKTKIVDIELSNIDKILSQLVEIEEKRSAIQSNEIKYLETKKQLLSEIDNAKKELPLPPPFVVATIATDAPLPPPPPPPPGGPKNLSGPKQNPGASQNQEKPASSKKEPERVNMGDMLAGSPQFLATQQAARAREQQEEIALKQREQKRKEEEYKILKEKAKQVDALIKEHMKNASPSPESIVLLNKYKARLNDVENQLSQMKEIDHKEELERLKQERDSAQKAQQEDYNKRLAQRDNLDVSSQETQVEKIAPELSESIPVLNDVAVSENQKQKGDSSIPPSQDPPAPELQKSSPIPEDQRNLIEKFLKDYRPHFWSNKNRKLQLERIRDAFNKDDKKQMDDVIKEVRSEMLNDDGTRKSNETRRMGKSKMEDFINAYAENTPKESNPRSVNKP